LHRYVNARASVIFETVNRYNLASAR
jgi:hypothetical protein